MIFTTGCATLQGPVERAKARKPQPSQTLNGFVYDQSLLWGIVEQWEVGQSLIYFESFRQLHADSFKVEVEVVRAEDGAYITVAKGELTGETSQHFAIAKLNVLKGKPKRGDQVWGLPVRETETLKQSE